MGADNSTINLSFHTIEEIIEQITKIGGHECFSNFNDNNNEITVEQNIAIYDQLNTSKLPCKICFLPRSASGYSENGFGICVFCYEIPYYQGDQYSTFTFYSDESKDTRLGKAYLAVRLFWWFDNDGEVGEFWIHNHENIIKETDSIKLRELAIGYRLDEFLARQSIMQIVKQKLGVPLPIIPNYSNQIDREYWLNHEIEDYIYYRKLMIGNIDDENILQMIANGKYHFEIKAYAATKLKNLDILFDLPLDSRKYVNFKNFQFDSYSDDEMSKLIQLYYPFLQDQDQVSNKFNKWIESTKDQSLLQWLFENYTHRFDTKIIKSYHDLNAIRSYLHIDQYGEYIEDIFHTVIKRLQKENELSEDDCMVVLRHTMEWDWEYDALSSDHYLLVAARFLTNELNQCEIILQHLAMQICEVICEKISEDTLFSLLKKSGRVNNMFHVISTLLRKYSHTLEYLLEWALFQDNSVVYGNMRIYLEDDYTNEEIDENLLKTFYKEGTKNRV